MSTEGFTTTLVSHPEATMEAQVIVDITREAEAGKLVELDPKKLYSAVVPSGTERKTLDLSQYLDEPKRATGIATLQTVDDLARYVTRHDNPDATTVWVNMDTHVITAVLDDHGQETPGWGQHRGLLRLKPTDQWTHWAGLDGKLVDQEAFAEHIQDGLPEIVYPPGATMLEVVQTMQGKTNADWKSAIRLTDGSIGFAYHEDATATAGGDGTLEIPEHFTLGISPFLGEDEYKVEATLRYRVRAGELKIGYKLARPGDVVRDAIDNIATRLAQTFTDRVFIGSPR